MGALRSVNNIYHAAPRVGAAEGSSSAGLLSLAGANPPRPVVLRLLRFLRFDIGCRIVNRG
jgi:hypothetical protein